MPDATTYRISELMERARIHLCNGRRRKSDAGKLIADLAQALADTANGDLTTCGTRHLADERALRIVERYGWPKDADMLLWLTGTTRDAGNTFNRNAVERPGYDDDVPF